MKCPECRANIPEDSQFCSKCGTSIKDRTDLSVSLTKTLQRPVISLGMIISGRYKIIEEIGRGGMGIVFKAEDNKLKRTVALKFLAMELTQDTNAKKRFVQEAQAAAALNHPNITTIHEIGDDQGQTFIVMEYVSGISLKKKLEAGPLEIADATDIVSQLADGLNEAHEKGIVHRDIKPANILLTNRGQAKITDFGLAKLAWGVDLTQASTLMGTVAYMSPEQARGETVDHRTDIWALGAMFFEMLSGKRPFQKSHEQALIYSILNDEPESIQNIRPDVPAYLVNTLEKAMKKNVAFRFQSVKEFERGLNPLMTTQPVDLQKSIAVLPFANMSADPEQDYFCDGMTEEIINALSHFSELRVVARTSVFSYKGKDRDIREIGKQLNVGKVLEGSVRKAGERLRIMVQLINVADGFHIWSERFDRNIGDVFEIQDEITLSIVKTLEVKLLKKEQETLYRHDSENVEAYSLYLKGRYIFWEMMSANFMEESMNYFKQALKKNPKYALAYAGLANSYIGLGWFGTHPPKVVFPKAEENANKALEISDHIEEAFIVLAYINNFYKFKWEAAEINCKRALEINPNSPQAHLQYAWFFLSQSHLDEALKLVQKALEYDPVSKVIASNLGMIHYFRGEPEKAIEVYKEVAKLDPDFYVAQSFLGCVYYYMQDYKKAIKQFQKTVGLVGGTYDAALLGHAYAVAGESDKAQKILEDLIEQQKERYVSPYDIARVYIGLGDRDEALNWLMASLDHRTSWLAYLNVDHYFKSLHADSRFIELQRKIGFDV